MDVQIGCLCPARADGTPRHPDGDTVTLRERLDFRAALTARNAMSLVRIDNPGAGAADMLAALTETYLILGIESWTLTNGTGAALPVSAESIRAHLLADVDAALTVADAADELYAAAVILPLVARASKSSPPTPTNGSMSPTTESSPRPPKPSRRSSTTTTPTDATGTTSPSPAGASSS